MSQNLEKLISEAIKLELNVSDLYMVFYEKFPEDAKFWWELVVEEKSHASLLETINVYNSVTGDFPFDLIPEQLDTLIEANKKILSIIESVKLHSDRKSAFNIAVEIEESAGELHYQKFMDGENDSEIFKIFRKLGGADSNHSKRIQQYIIENGLDKTY